MNPVFVPDLLQFFPADAFRAASRRPHTELARLLSFVIQKEKPMPAKLKTRHAAVAALLAGALILSSGASFAQMGNMPMSKDAQKTAAKSASGTGTVVALNTAGKKVTLDHGPMPDIDWPAMKMEFPVAPSVDLSKVKTGDKVRFTLTGSGKNYTVQSISPQ